MVIIFRMANLAFPLGLLFGQMDSFAKSGIRYSKSQRAGLFVFVFGLLMFEIFSLKLNFNKTEEEFAVVTKSEIVRTPLQSGQFDKTALSEFDPNELDQQDWMKLGFSEKQSNTIIKYKYSLGGYFSGRQQLSECFVISEKKFAEIEPYIVFGDFEKHKNQNSNFQSSDSNQKINYKKFNPNQYSQKDWQKIGFSEKQAASIIKYKMSLGGNFSSVDQIKSCYMISEKKFYEMRPYIVLASVASKPKKSFQDNSSIKLIETQDTLSESGTISIIED